MKLTPWQKIIRAAKAGRSLRLSVDECWQLRMDDAIETKAQNDDIEQGLLEEVSGMELKPKKRGGGK